MIWIWLLVPLVLLAGAAVLGGTAHRLGRERAVLAEQVGRLRHLRPTGPDQVHR